MSKDMKSVDEMVDYVRQLRLHAEGRRAIHVKLSILEKHFREEHGRRFVAVTLRQLITNFGATMFALPNTDVVLVVKGAKVDYIDTLLAHIRKKFKSSEALKGLDPIQGKSDPFVTWFDLEADYSDFRKYVEKFADRLKGSAPKKSALREDGQDRTKSPGMLEIQSRPAERVAPPRKMKMVPISAPEKDTEMRELDPELLVALNKALIVADVGGMLRKQKVMAILGVHQPQPVMEHRFVPAHVLYEKLLSAHVYGENRWLEGYLRDLLASRVLFANPNMQNENSIASSLRVSCASVVDSSFEQFDQSLGAQPRSTVIIEFGATDVLTDFGAYKTAVATLNSYGYRIMVADVDPRALMWLNYEKFDADFVKLRMPSGEVGEWLDLDTEEMLQHQITQIGIARVILDGCNTQHEVEVGQRLGITLFQGEAVSPTTS